MRRGDRLFMGEYARHGTRRSPGGERLMCSIVGVLGAEAVDSTLVERMRDRLAHRGPDAAGLWASDDGRVVLGHRRLSIIDTSAAASQPFLSTDGSLP